MRIVNPYRYATAAGGPDAWYNAHEPGDLSSSRNLQDTWIVAQIVTLAAGTVTQLRAYLTFVNGASDLYLSLHNSDGTSVSGGNGSVSISSGNDQWHAVTGLSATVTATDYYICVSQNGPFSGALVLKADLSGATSGDSKLHLSKGYADMPTESWTGFSNVDDEYALGAYVD